MLKILTVFLLYFIKDATLKQTCEAENKYPWSYHGTTNGPTTWKKSYEGCTELGQAPIDIKKDYFLDTMTHGLVFKGFDQPITKATVENLGWTVMITPKDGVHRSMTWVTEEFDLENITFHFGTENNPGAENVIFGVRHTMEIKYYAHGNARTPMILSTFMDAADDNNPALGPITDILPDVMYRGDSTELKSDLDLSKLLPKNTSDVSDYLLYEGSKTIPPCEPIYLIWLFRTVGEVGRDQLNSFMSLYSVKKEDASDDCLMGPNYRPLQEYATQIVYSPVGETRNGS